MENNLYKNFLTGYNYLYCGFHNIWKQLFINIIMFGMRWGFYIINQPWFQELQRVMNQYRHRKEDIRSEPTENNDNWICVSQMIPKTERNIRNLYFWNKPTESTRKNKFNLKEKYFNPIDTYDVDKSSKINEVFCSLYIHYFNIKDKRMRQVSVSASTFNEHLVKDSIVPSKVSFIDIQYSHPSMSNPLVLDISKDYFLVGNELFSPAFVQRMLYYQPYPFVFDLDYSLEIMDKDLNSVSLKSNQYIRLSESDYQVIDLS